MRKKQILALALTVCISSHLFGQEPECIKDFEYLVERVQNDYPGYQDKVNSKSAIELKKLESTLRKKIIQYPDSCGHFLNMYTAWFKDFHLRVSVNRQQDTRGTKHKKKYHEIDINSLSHKTDALEGIWVGYRGEIAVVNKTNTTYVGVSIDLAGYDKGQVIFEATDVNNNEFELTAYRGNGGIFPLIKKASLHVNNSILEIHGNTRYVKKSNDDLADKALLISYIAQYPNGINIYPVAALLGDSTFYLRIPNFYSNTANDFVQKYWDEIMSRPNLVIDIRENDGGQDIYYQKLAEIIYTNPYESKGVEWYSTEGIVADWEESIKSGNIKEGYEEESRALVEEMKKNIGGFVVHPYYGGDMIIERDTIYSYPKKVGIIINGGNASSAEQFLLDAKQSTKVVLFGNENSAGVLDYSNITPKELPSGNYSLWLPATRSRRLPDNPIDNIGIAPEISIPLKPQEQLFNRLDDWAYYVKNYLELIE
jgi:hypothetical protein